MPDPMPPFERLPDQAIVHMQARIPGLAPSANHKGTVSLASSTLSDSPIPATLDTSRYNTVWSESFDTGFGQMNRRWGDVTLSNGEAILKSSAAGNWAAAGMMQAPTGASAGQGYGLYSITARTDPSEGPGPFACLWPATDVWPGPELDLFEKASQSNTDGYSTVHWAGTDSTGKAIDQYQVYRFSGYDMSQYHTYAMDWSPDRISLYIDNALIWTTTEHVPKSYADGGQNECFGAGMQPAWAAAQQNGTTNVLHVTSMSYAAPKPAPPDPTISVADATVTEGGVLSFTVSLSAASTHQVTVSYGTANGSAAAGSDYTARSGTLTFAAGETSKAVTVQTTQDTVVEPDETLLLRLSTPAGGTIARAEATGTITNDDVAAPGRVITGTSGGNRLTGTSGNDTITGGRGNDTMTGYAGEDNFVFSAGDGFDRIRDFQPGTDNLVFKGLTEAQVTYRAATYWGVSGTDVFYGSGTANHVFLEKVAASGFSMARDVIFT